MPIHKVGNKWQYGTHGHKYPTRKGAERQAAAIHAAGYHESHEDEELDVTGMQESNKMKLMTFLEFVEMQKNVINEVHPPGMEDFINKSKSHFEKEYGAKKGKEYLYRTAWKLHNKTK